MIFYLRHNFRHTTSSIDIVSLFVYNVIKHKVNSTDFSCNDIRQDRPFSANTNE